MKKEDLEGKVSYELCIAPYQNLHITIHADDFSDDEITELMIYVIPDIMTEINNEASPYTAVNINSIMKKFCYHPYSPSNIMISPLPDKKNYNYIIATSLESKEICVDINELTIVTPLRLP